MGRGEKHNNIKAQIEMLLLLIQAKVMMMKGVADEVKTVAEKRLGWWNHLACEVVSQL